MKSTFNRVSSTSVLFCLFCLICPYYLAGQGLTAESAAADESVVLQDTLVKDTASISGGEVGAVLKAQYGATVGLKARAAEVTSGYEPMETELTALKDMAGARLWWYGWLAGYSVATVGQGVVYFTSDDKTLRQDMALGAATTFLGAMNQLITPLDPKPRDYPTYREYASGETSMSSDQAAMLLKSLAAWEKKGRSWKTHALAGAVNLGSGLITWLGFKRTVWDGVANFALNTAVTEAQIWTQPVKAVRDYEKYSRETGTGIESMTSERDGEWSWSIYPGGFYVRYVF